MIQLLVELRTDFLGFLPDEMLRKPRTCSAGAVTEQEFARAEGRGPYQASADGGPSASLTTTGRRRPGRRSRAAAGSSYSMNVTIRSTGCRATARVWCARSTSGGARPKAGH